MQCLGCEHVSDVRGDDDVGLLGNGVQGETIYTCKKSDFNFYILHSCNLRIKIIWFYCF